MNREQAHQLLDRLDSAQFTAVGQLLEVPAADPLPRALEHAGVEDREITDDTAAALDRSRTSLARGEGITHEEVLREFGLTR